MPPVRDHYLLEHLPTVDTFHKQTPYFTLSPLTGKSTATLSLSLQKMRGTDSSAGSLTESITKRLQSFPYSQGLYSNLPTASGEPTTPTSPTSPTAGSRPKHGITSAPDVTLPGQLEVQPVAEPVTVAAALFAPVAASGPIKKKYAKEAWPGKKPAPALLI